MSKEMNERFNALALFATKCALALGGEMERELAAMIDKWNEEDKCQTSSN